MTATAADLRDLHELHQRAKALRDRLTSGPKTLAARRRPSPPARRRSTRPARPSRTPRSSSRSASTCSRAAAKIDDLKVKLNLVKKNEEYKAIQNQIAHDKASMAKLEDEILEAYGQIETQAADLAALEAEVKKFAAEVAAIRPRSRPRPPTQKAQLAELEAAIIGAEDDHPRGPARAVPPHRQAARRRRHGLRRGRCLLRLLRLRHRADDQRADQRPHLIFCKTLRPDPLPGRGRHPQHATSAR